MSEAIAMKYEKLVQRTSPILGGCADGVGSGPYCQVWWPAADAAPQQDQQPLGRQLGYVLFGHPCSSLKHTFTQQWRKVQSHLTAGTVHCQQEALEECKALAQTWLAEPGAALPDLVASGGTTGKRVTFCLTLGRMRVLRTAEADEVSAANAAASACSGRAGCQAGAHHEVGVLHNPAAGPADAAGTCVQQLLSIIMATPKRHIKLAVRQL
jgi:hypothetical protein